MKKNTKPDRRRRGSTLVTVVFLTLILTVLVSSLLSYSLTEKRINVRHGLWLEARNAAESMVEYGFADLVRRLSTQVSLPEDELKPDNNPLTIPSSATTLFAGSNIVTGKFELRGGQIPQTATTVFIDPNDPANEFDPLKGKRANVREIAIVGRAVAVHPLTGAEVEAHCLQVLQVRDSALFSHAVFYNLDLEFHPGPFMAMQGPVHSNHDMYIQAIGGLDFHSTVTSAGHIYRTNKHGSEWQTGTIRVRTPSGEWRTMSLEMDSRHSDWESLASNRWHGNVQTAVHGVRSLNPVGIKDYVADDPLNPNYTGLNHGYALIEPQLGIDPDLDPDTKGVAVENEKFSAKAGLIVRVTDINDPSGWKLFTYQTANPHEPVSTSNPPLRDADGFPIEIEIPQTDELRQIIVNEPFSDSGSAVHSGLWDRRENAGQNLTVVDIARLRKALDDHAPGYADAPEGRAAWGGAYEPEKQFSGVLYIEMPLQIPVGSTSHTSRADHIRPSIANHSVKLVNGLDLPNPSYNHAAGRNPGFTVATNAPLYVFGHYNSDGNTSTGSATSPDNKPSDRAEVPAAIAADAITILSPAFNKNTKSKTKAVHTEVSAALLTGLTPTIPKSVVDTNNASGGAHNFPRFMEDWGSRDFVYRGSLVALFESEVANSPWPVSHSHIYNPPRRFWGFHDFFAEGKFPPGTPYTRDFRRIEFRDLSAQEYKEVVEAFFPSS
ncbi:MAG: hypothetical protein EA425_13430 [Puniceicoccaceae bacterium]|nr:MAG: hypothetical protein EA425_13430 [Puniceicoccaceae bacterium]